MRDLDRPLKIVNGPLWEEIRNSSEKEVLKSQCVNQTAVCMGSLNSKRTVQISFFLTNLNLNRKSISWAYDVYSSPSLCVCFISQLKSFGAKLKERNNLFRKTSKVQSHEMKEVLYSNLVQANLVRVFKQKYSITTL